MLTNRKKLLTSLLFLIKIIVLLSCISGLALFLGTFLSISKVLPPTEKISNLLRPGIGTKIFSEDGVLLAHISEEHREFVALEKIPPALQLATIAIEDDRFYKHPGVDLRSIARALWTDVRRAKIVQGGSTITQQLARNIYLTRKRTLSRKLQEVMLALQLERRLSKLEILELYLNQICYGHSAYGVQTAAQLYFGKPVWELDLAECALLAALPRRPAYYSPYENMNACKKRQRIVLDRMAKLGYITPQEAQKAKNKPFKLTQPKLTPSQFKAPYFVDYVLKQLINSYGADLLYKGNLAVYTTLDSQLQKAAEEALAYGLRIAELQKLKISQGALIALDPKTGYIKAMVGGRDYKISQWNRATQAKRQPGSGFKPFVYTTAIEMGLSPSYRIIDSPVTYKLSPTKYYRPKNYGGKFSYKPTTLKTALTWSKNVVTVKLAEKIGPKRIRELAHRMGITQTLQPDLSLALGSYEVTPLEMTSAFAVFANKGIRCEPQAIKQVIYGDGSILMGKQPRRRRVLSKETAAVMRDLLRNVVTHGTGKAANIAKDAAGKTGTSSDYKDAWFIGFISNLACAVWMGNDDGRPTRHVSGGSLPARTWARFMKSTIHHLSPKEKLNTIQKAQTTIPSPEATTEETQKLPPTVEEEPKPKTEELPLQKVKELDLIPVTICRESGKIANEYCPDTITKMFTPDKKPTQTCDFHGFSPLPRSSAAD